MKIRNEQDLPQRMRWARGLAVLLAVATLMANVGCVTTETVPFGGSGLEPVSEGRAKRDLGIDYLSTRRTAMAIRELSSAMRLEPDDPETHLWLGEAYRRKGKAEQAETLLEGAIRLAEDQERPQVEQAARLNLSALLSQLGRYEEALVHCEVLVADPTLSTPWSPLNNCGWALMQLGRLDEAKVSFHEALDFFPRFGPALLNLGILQTKQGHPLKAIRTLEKALDSGRLNSSGLGEAHYRLGEIYVGLGRRDKAVVHFEEATAKAPYAEWSSQSQAYLDLLH